MTAFINYHPRMSPTAGSRALSAAAVALVLIILALALGLSTRPAADEPKLRIIGLSIVPDL